jgi:hypothetical protein
MKIIFKLIVASLFLTAKHTLAQNACSSLQAPDNPYFSNVEWPTYHHDNYRQASTCFAGPRNGDKIKLKLLKNLKGGTSCWTYLTEPYKNGKRVILQSNSTHFYKIEETDNGFEIIDKFEIDKDFMKSFSWNFLLAKNNIWYTYDPKFNPAKKEFSTIFKLSDDFPKNPQSKIKLDKSFSFGDLGKVQFFGLNYRGEIMFYSDNDKGKRNINVGVLSANLELIDVLTIPSLPNEIGGHNAFPIDENNSMYFQTTQRFFKINWDGAKLKIAYEAKYDFVADGPKGKWAEGSGTTPTLIGRGVGDKLAVMADGHKKNNLVAFWRELPKDWKGIPGQDIHFAGKIELPAAERFSDLFQSIENSPCAFGYDVYVAQFNGFLGQKSPTKKGVQKVRWNTTTRQFEIIWVNKEVNLNGVLTYSYGSNMVYGSGKEDNGEYYYYGLDAETGKVVWKYLLGKSSIGIFNPFDDGGNGNIIDKDGNIYFTGSRSLIKLEVVK